MQLVRHSVRIHWILSISLLLLAGCAGANLSADSQSMQSVIHDTSDGRPLAEGDIDKSGSILTVPISKFQHYAYETRTDEYGEYLVTKIDTPSVDSVKNRGPSMSAFISALEFYTEFLSTQILDSIAFDNYANYDKWVKDIAPKYISAKYFDQVVNAQASGESWHGVIFNNYEVFQEKVYDHQISILKRDGGPRVFNKHLWGLRAESRGAGLYIWSMGAATIIFDDKAAAIWDPLFWDMPDSTYVPEQFQDGKDQVAQFGFQVGLALVRDGDSWKITDFENYFSARNIGSFLPAPKRLLQVRNQVIK